jgi:hypothetical protein
MTAIAAPVTPIIAALAVRVVRRGVAGDLPALVRRHCATQFARLDRRLHSPLCLAPGGGFLILALNGVGS